MKNANRTAPEAFQEEAEPHLRVTDVADTINDANVRAAIARRKQELASGPDAIARAVAFVVDRPDDVEIGSIVVRPTAQG